jgi:hypothetical protein
MGSKKQVTLVVVLVLLVLTPQIVARDWWVEDAAIAFSYARNIANGDGVVPFPGGERVEGYSDPLWVALLTLGQIVGLNPFLLSKVLGGIFAAAAVPLAAAIAARLPVPADPPWLSRAAPWLAAFLVATNAHHEVWAAAGLENALFTFLLALGTWLVLSEDGRFPWSALAFLGLALTRSEGVVYAAVGLGLGAWLDVRSRRFRRVSFSFALFTVPFLLWHAARYEYFALPFPLPYYAKVVDESFAPMQWGGRSWTYLRGWASDLGWGWFLPVLAVGVAGTRGARAAMAAAVTLLLAIAMLVPGVPTEVKIALLLVAWPLGPVLATGRSRVLVLSATCLAVTLAFAFRARGDWMAGYRWFSLCAVPLAVLFASGTAEIAARLPRRVALPAFVLLAALPIVASAHWLIQYAYKPEAMTPETTRGRVKAFQRVADRIHLDRPWIAFDHAMGGMMWWAPPSTAIDLYGLTDVMFALQRGKTGFVSSWLPDSRIDFAHVKGTLVRQKVFKERFVPLPAKGGRNFDNWMARRLLTVDRWPEGSRMVFEGGHRIEGFTVRSPEVAPGGGLYVEVGMARDDWNPNGFTVQVFITGPATVQFSAAPGYNDIFPPKRWLAGEIFAGRYAFPLPADLPEGAYDLGFIVRTADGVVEAPIAVPPGARVDVGEAAVAPGEVVFAKRIQVMSAKEVAKLANADWDRAAAAAQNGDCAAADDVWRDALEHRPTDAAWRAELQRRASQPLSECWARKSRSEGVIEAEVADLDRARRWDVRSPSALAAGRELAGALWPEAMSARLDGNHAEALRLFQAIVHGDPSQSWARRYAEEARAAVLARR